MLLCAEDVHRSYFRGTIETMALRGVSMQVVPGSYHAISGPSGSGKSTLLQMLGLLDRPTHGQVWMDDIDTATLSDDELAKTRRIRLGFVFQSFQLLPGLRAWENVAVPLLLNGVRLHELRERAITQLEEVGLGMRSDHRPDELSGGEQQRVAIARALIADPEVVLADEPTGALDATTAVEVISLLEAVTVSRGRSLVMVSHDRSISARAGSQLVLLDGQRADSRDT
jgi:putative ABC transport system ATP-binding protein